MTNDPAFSRIVIEDLPVGEARINFDFCRSLMIYEPHLVVGTHSPCLTRSWTERSAMSSIGFVPAAPEHSSVHSVLPAHHVSGPALRPSRRVGRPDGLLGSTPARG